MEWKISAARLAREALSRGDYKRARAKLAAAAPKRRVELWHTLGAALLILLLGEALLLRRK